MRADSFAGQVLAVFSRRAPAFQPRSDEPSTFPAAIWQRQSVREPKLRSLDVGFAFRVPNYSVGRPQPRSATIRSAIRSAFDWLRDSIIYDLLVVSVGVSVPTGLILLAAAVWHLRATSIPFVIVVFLGMAINILILDLYMRRIRRRSEKEQSAERDQRKAERHQHEHKK